MNGMLDCNYKKLVRDKIPEIIEENDGTKPHTQVVTGIEYRTALIEKLVEEAKELQEATTEDELLEEFADVLEVIDALSKTLDTDKTKQIQIKKRAERGGFDRGAILVQEKDV